MKRKNPVCIAAPPLFASFIIPKSGVWSLNNIHMTINRWCVEFVLCCTYSHVAVFLNVVVILVDPIQLHWGESA